jgi:recombinational DNA repair protein RecR
MHRPVYDVHGHEIRFVRVVPNEKTCLTCGEVTAGDYCPRCSDHEQGIVVRTLTPTLSYLRADEFVLVS